MHNTVGLCRKKKYLTEYTSISCVPLINMVNCFVCDWTVKEERKVT